MSIFDRIRSAIFRRGETSAHAPAPAASGQSTGAAVNRAPPGAGGSSAPAAPQARTAVPSPPSASRPPTPQPADVDVEAVLEGLARENKQPLNWRKSIVDLMKLLDMDSSVSERRKLAKELGYTGSSDDSAAMNIWLHKQVMRKLAENGGKVPAELRD